MSTRVIGIKDANIVLPHGVFRGSLTIAGGKILSISGDGNAPPCDVTIDAKGKYLLPGLIDPHMHLGLASDFGKECFTETVSAAFGGVTTVVNFLLETRPYSSLLQQRRKEFQSNSVVDGAFHVIILNQAQLDELDRLIDFGIRSFKYFLAYRGDEALTHIGIVGADDGFLLEAMEKAAATHTICMFHCEDSEIAVKLKNRLRVKGLNDSVAWSESRPNLCEEESMRRVLFLAGRTRCRAYIVHMSIAEGVDLVRKALMEGCDVIAETLPRYLALTKYDWKEDFVKTKCAPPLRDHTDQEALWQGLLSGTIKCVGSDHNAYTIEEKLGSDGDVWSARPGTPEVETMLLVLLDGISKGLLTYERLVQVTSLNPAKIFGLYPRKGVIQVGSDADLVLVNPTEETLVKADQLHSRADYTPYEGKSLRGKPVMVIRRGEIVVQDGEFVSKRGTGSFLPNLSSSPEQERS